MEFGKDFHNIKVIHFTFKIFNFKIKFFTFLEKKGIDGSI